MMTVSPSGVSPSAEAAVSSHPAETLTSTAQFNDPSAALWVKS